MTVAAQGQHPNGAPVPTLVVPSVNSTGGGGGESAHRSVLAPLSVTAPRPPSSPPPIVIQPHHPGSPSTTASDHLPISASITATAIINDATTSHTKAVQVLATSTSNSVSPSQAVKEGDWRRYTAGPGHGPEHSHASPNSITVDDGANGPAF